MAVPADHKGLSAGLGHDCGPGGLRLSGPLEVGEPANVVHLDVACSLAELTSSLQQSVDQLPVGIDGAGGPAVGEDRVLLPLQGDADAASGRSTPRSRPAGGWGWCEAAATDRPARAWFAPLLGRLGVGCRGVPAGGCGAWRRCARRRRRGFPHVPSIGYLGRVRCAAGDAVGVAAGAVAAYDLYAGVAGRPGGQRLGGAFGQHVDGPTGVHVDQDRAVVPSAAQREVVHAQHTRPADAGCGGVGQGADHPDQGHPVDRCREPAGQPGAGSSAQCQGDVQIAPMSRATTPGPYDRFRGCCLIPRVPFASGYAPRQVGVDSPARHLKPHQTERKGSNLL